jgi:hypothetical protein
MTLPEIVSREQWLAARRELLAREKEQTRQRDALNADRRRLPMVRIDKDYRFDGPGGPVRLLDMFGDNRQLVMQHVMFDPGWDEACPELLGRSRRAVRWAAGASGGPQYQVRGGVPRATGQDRGVPGAQGLGLSLVLVGR